eukprot:TRINITY_DN3229_c1_g1_i5.p1 TRINITY_DN3229_c1_g1~~TRINITY_DN3229_c1_g1_i5.p1  ORF type:complete len:859 (+),score=201.02 TRINITY_DN3229_c1_g1_i5:29-2605(+)
MSDIVSKAAHIVKEVAHDLKGVPFGAIFSVIARIAQQVQYMKVNKRLGQQLSERVCAIRVPLEEFKSRLLAKHGLTEADLQTCQLTLGRVMTTLKQCLNVIETHGNRGAVMKFLLASSIKDDFEAANRELSVTINDLVFHQIVDIHHATTSSLQMDDAAIKAAVAAVADPDFAEIKQMQADQLRHTELLQQELLQVSVQLQEGFQDGMSNFEHLVAQSGDNKDTLQRILSIVKQQSASSNTQMDRFMELMGQQMATTMDQLLKRVVTSAQQAASDAPIVSPPQTAAAVTVTSSEEDAASVLTIDRDEVIVDFQKPLGAPGGFATVYQGQWLGLPVAVKVFHAQFAGTSFMTRMLWREVSIAKRIIAPNIVQVFGAFLHRGTGAAASAGVRQNTPCIVMELCQGGSLRSCLDALSAAGQSLDQAVVIAYALSIARAVAGMHSRRITHRDLKCDNVLLRTINATECVAVLGDLGLARAADEIQRRTQTSTNAFSLNHCSPEVLDQEAYTWRSDVYSFGIFLWELATSRRPYDKLKPSVIMKQIAMGKLPEPMPANAELAALVQKCCALEPEERPAMSEVVAALLASANVLQQQQQQQRKRLFVLGRDKGFVFDGTHWTSCHSISSTVRNRVSKSSDDSVYIMGEDLQLWVYTISTDRVTKHSSDRVPSDGFPSLVKHADTLYCVACGDRVLDYGKKIYALYPAATQWEHVVTLCNEYSYPSVGVIGNKVYISGYKGAECYDSVSNTCVALSGTSAIRAGYCVYQNKLYVAGGANAQAVNKFMVYDPVTDRWTRLADMPTGRWELSLVVYGDRLWAIGGVTELSFEETHCAVVESYDVRTNIWRAETSLPEPIAYCGAIVM